MELGGSPTWTTPFSAPGYQIKTVHAERGIAFDVVHCPVASYFRERGAADLCLAAWCNLDFALSDLTQQQLIRTKTLVEGADHCDFRVLPLVSSTLPHAWSSKSGGANGQ